MDRLLRIWWCDGQGEWESAALLPAEPDAWKMLRAMTPSSWDPAAVRLWDWDLRPRTWESLTADQVPGGMRLLACRDDGVGIPPGWWARARKARNSAERLGLQVSCVRVAGVRMMQQIEIEDPPVAVACGDGRLAVVDRARVRVLKAADLRAPAATFAHPFGPVRAAAFAGDDLLVLDARGRLRRFAVEDGGEKPLHGVPAGEEAELVFSLPGRWGWVTRSGAICLATPGETVRYEPEMPGLAAILSVQEVPGGGLLLGSSDGLHRFDTASGRVTRVWAGPPGAEGGCVGLGDAALLAGPGGIVLVGVGEAPGTWARIGAPGWGEAWTTPQVVASDGNSRFWVLDSGVLRGYRVLSVPASASPDGIAAPHVWLAPDDPDGPFFLEDEFLAVVCGIAMGGADAAEDRLELLLAAARDRELTADLSGWIAVQQASELLGFPAFLARWNDGVALWLRRDGVLWRMEEELDPVEHTGDPPRALDEDELVRILSGSLAGPRRGP